MSDILIPAPYTAHDARKIAGWILGDWPAVMSSEFCGTVAAMLHAFADHLESDERHACFAADRPTEPDGVR